MSCAEMALITVLHCACYASSLEENIIVFSSRLGRILFASTCRSLYYIYIIIASTRTKYIVLYTSHTLQ